MGATFRSGHVLALRRFPASSLGSAYTSVWHYFPDAGWTIWTDGDPDRACPRYFGKALSESEVAPITITWSGPRRFTVNLGEGELVWTVMLEPTLATRLLNAMSRAMSESAWRNESLLERMEAVAGRMLRAGQLGLFGRTPNGQHFDVSRLQVWNIAASEAVLGAEDLGTLGPLPEQLHLGDFWIPKAPLFAVARASFERSSSPQPHRRMLVPA